MRFFDFKLEKITSIVLSQAGRKLFVGTEKGHIRAFNASTLVQTDELDFTDSGRLSSKNVEIVGM